MDGDDRISRRRVVQAGGGLAGVFLAGCTRDVGEEFPPNRKYPVGDVVPSLPVEQRADVMAERIEHMAAMPITDLTTFADVFDPYALEVESVGLEREILTVEYINTELYEEGNLHDIGLVAGGFAALVSTGFDALALSITILDAAPASFGIASIESEWAEAYNAGTISATEYGELVAETIESKRHPPEVGISPN